MIYLSYLFFPRHLRKHQPENILLSTTENATNVKLCDFGMSHRIFGLESLRTVCGSPGYMAPEIVKQVSDFECLFY